MAIFGGPAKQPYIFVQKKFLLMQSPINMIINGHILKSQTLELFLISPL